MSIMDLALIFLVVGAAVAWLLRMVFIRFAVSGRVPRMLTRLPSLLFLVIGIGFACWYFFIGRADSIQTTDPGERVMLVGRVMEVALAEDDGHASVYILEDPTGRVEVATESHPPQSGAYAIVRGRVMEYDGRRIVYGETRLATF